MAKEKKPSKEKAKKPEPKQVKPAEKAKSRQKEESKAGAKRQRAKAEPKKEAVEKKDAGKGKQKKDAGTKEKKQEKSKGKEKKQEKKDAGTKEKKQVKIAKSRAVKKLSSLVKSKKRRRFRGRFGKRSVRNVSKAKWQRWRKPRGMDIYFKKEDGLVPGIGYRTQKKIRFVHPSGMRERLVYNMHELEAIEARKGVVAARISAKVGKRKRKEMLKRAEELKIFVLNR